MPDVDVRIDVEASLAAMPNQGVLLCGVPAMKGMEDLARYNAVIQQTRPDLIIQTGTAVGGSALWFASGGLDVITIDIDTAAVHPNVLASERIVVITGSSTDAEIFHVVESAAVAYERVMVVLDSDHSSEHVREEIRLYGPLVSGGCYLVVEDGIYDLAAEGPFKPGPLDAIAACLINDPEWERDLNTESLEPVSMYPAGWWVKK